MKVLGYDIRRIRRQFLKYLKKYKVDRISKKDYRSIKSIRFLYIDEDKLKIKWVYKDGKENQLTNYNVFYYYVTEGKSTTGRKNWKYLA